MIALFHTTKVGDSAIPPGALTQPKANLGTKLLRSREFGVLLALVVVGAFFSIATDTLLRPMNLLNVIRQISELGIVAVAMTILITAQEFDLSVGSIYALSAVITGLLVRDLNLTIWLAAAVGLAAAVVLTVVGWILLQKTSFGFKVYATGGNKEAATLSGINTAKIKKAFMLTGLAAGIAGLVSLSYLGSVAPTQGNGMELEAIAASVIGGTALMGGVGTILGAFLGATIMGAIRNGLVLMGTSAYLQESLHR